MQQGTDIMIHATAAQERGSAAEASVASIESRGVVLYVHGSAEMYGSDKVLLYLVEGVAHGREFTPVVVLHESGPLLDALVAAGIEVHVATVVKINRAMFGPGAPLALTRLLKASLRDLDGVVNGRPVALVHSNTLAVLGGAVWAWRRGHRHLWHVHEIILKPALVRRALPWLADRLSQCVMSNSTLTQQWLLAQVPRLKPRAVVVFNGLPGMPAPAAHRAAAFRNRIGAADADVVATLAGRLNHWKGQGLLIEAVGLLAQQRRLGSLRVAIVGDVFAGQDEIRLRLARRIDELGLADRVRLLPFTSDIYSVWRGSQIAVVPSTEPEPFGMVAIEAMACGLPVIAAGHGGLLDIVVPEQTGVLFKPGDAGELADALARLSEDAMLRAALGRAGADRQRQEFSMRRQIDDTLNVYRGLQAA